MSVFFKAARDGVRFNTTRGPLSTEQLFGLSINDLDGLAVSLQEAYDGSKRKSFIQKKSKKDKDLKLQFDVVHEILQYKVQVTEKSRTAAETRAHNQKIMSLIAEKQGDELKGMSIEELEAQLR